jgi:3-oxoacyl-[acyl-carrier-protein] synthase-1
MTMAIYLNALGLVCSLGSGVHEVRRALAAADAPHGLVDASDFLPGRTLPVGRVHAALPASDTWPLWQRSRNNQLAAEALRQIDAAVREAIERHGPGRVAVVLGGSTSGVREGEAAVQRRQQEGAWPAGYHYRQQELGTTAGFVAEACGAQGPAYVISTACSSGAKALAAGARLLNAGMADAVIAGGVDTLCAFTLAGFGALESLSGVRCNPLSKHRNGINLGEGAALFLMTREPGPVRLAGWGETVDAHHMSAPDPEGRGAIDAMRQALQRGGVAPEGVDYINLHGTATPQNDAMESRAVAAVLGHEVPVSSTKPMTGHALGAAGAIEAAFGWLALADNPRGVLPPHWWDGEADMELPRLNPVPAGATLGRPLRHVLSNSFAFGGSNAAVLLGAG